MQLTIKEIASFLDLPFVGDGSYSVESIAPVQTAQSHQLSFVVSKKYLSELKSCSAGVVIVPPELKDYAPGKYIVSMNPYISYARLSHLFYPSLPAGDTPIHPTAVVHPGATIASSARIGANAVIEQGVNVGHDCVVGAGCFLGADVQLADRTYLFANVTIYHACKLGTDCRIQSGAVVGAEGFGYAPVEDGWLRINQVGSVVLGNHVEIGANTTIDRGALGDTVIEDGVILDNQIQIAHNVHIGRNTAIAGCTAIAGSTTIGANCTIAGDVSIIGHLNITDNVHLTANSLVLRSIDEPGRYSSGMPLQKNRQWLRTLKRITQLDTMASKLKKL